ncbi:unnamed protein product [Protopolystoma xenopodis]|uniref:Uncharacterized protein n=1 Tax=Protopolystoma xenopodis TaxID=117903 RepID=A0A448XP84_9PLAT|nr:unnamed protein product [Protopolystoma xenopodis]
MKTANLQPADGLYLNPRSNRNPPIKAFPVHISGRTGEAGGETAHWAPEVTASGCKVGSRGPLPGFQSSLMGVERIHGPLFGHPHQDTTLGKYSGPDGPPASRKANENLYRVDGSVFIPADPWKPANHDFFGGPDIGPSGRRGKKTANIRK